MKHCIDPSLLRMLRHGVEVGLWTLEDLDTPSPGFRTCTAVDRRTFPSGYEGVQFRNLLRDMDTPMEAVQAVPDPKDFATVLPPSNTPSQAPKLPLTLDEEEGPSPVQEREPLKANEHPDQPDELQPVAGSEALPW